MVKSKIVKNGQLYPRGLICSCPMIKLFWSTVQTEIENLLGIKIAMDPKQCIFVHVLEDFVRVVPLSIYFGSDRPAIINTGVN